jgi:hypothetical protein
LAWCCRKPAAWLGLELWLALRLGRLTEPIANIADASDELLRGITISVTLRLSQVSSSARPLPQRPKTLRQFQINQSEAGIVTGISVMLQLMLALR